MKQSTENPTTAELRWDLIQQTRERERNTNEPMPGSYGRAFFRQSNGIVDRCLVLTKDRHFNVQIQRIPGSQLISVAIEHLRTEKEILDALKARFPQHMPATKPNPKTGQMPPAFNPNRLPREVVNAIWDVK